MLRRPLLLFVLIVSAPLLAQAQQQAAPAAAAPRTQADTNYSFVRYRADYEVRADASSVETDEYEILLKTKSAVEQFSQVRLSYSEKMETLEVLAAYTVTAEGLRQDVATDKIYTQESYSSASAAMYADRKVKVVVFPNLAPGARIVYRVRRAQNSPYFPGYFSLWETFSVFAQYDDAVVTLVAPKALPMHLSVRGLQGGSKPVVRGDQARWEWRYQRAVPMKNQNWSAATWEFSPTLMASTFDSWSQIGLAYHVKGGRAAAVTPAIQTVADQVTQGIDDPRAQAAALYAWVARNIRYVAVYLGNGGLEPNSADSILANHYGDCKDHTVILEALLAAKGIASTPVLIGAEGGPTLPLIPVLGRFNHAITYIPAFDLYVDSTNPYARFGQLPAGDLGAPVVHTRDGKLTHTPPNDRKVNRYVARTEYRFTPQGGLQGLTTLDSGQTGEVGLRAMFVQLNAQNRIYTTTSAEDNLTPFYCNDSVREETYVVTFPETVPIIAIPRSSRFRNAAGEYAVDWTRQGQTVTAIHRLQRAAVRGPQALCQPQDYRAFRELYQQVRRGFRGQIVYGDLSRVQTAQ
ncbi:DUF3857 and transglutaminase domain-containing protein [Xanthomonas cannabis]|uniref:DUF3857 domain-containing transglutaminase family protein n=1 Tax=Xanthomonas cannabis TaxID=1885674 RepID=UPI0033B2CBF8